MMRDDRRLRYQKLWIIHIDAKDLWLIFHEFLLKSFADI